MAQIAEHYTYVDKLAYPLALKYDPNYSLKKLSDTHSNLTFKNRRPIKTKHLNANTMMSLSVCIISTLILVHVSPSELQNQQGREYNIIINQKNRLTSFTTKKMLMVPHIKRPYLLFCD